MDINDDDVDIDMKMRRERMAAKNGEQARSGEEEGYRKGDGN